MSAFDPPPPASIPEESRGQYIQLLKGVVSALWGIYDVLEVVLGLFPEDSTDEAASLVAGIRETDIGSDATMLCRHLERCGAYDDEDDEGVTT
jgi:hypothetical protein